MSLHELPGVAARVHDDDEHDHDDHDNDTAATVDHGAAYMRNGPGPFGLSDSDGGDDRIDAAFRAAGGLAAGGVVDSPDGHVSVTIAGQACATVGIAVSLVIFLVVGIQCVVMMVWHTEPWQLLAGTFVAIAFVVKTQLPRLSLAAVRSASRG